MTTALVLSAGGMFGAWQAGAWAAVARRIQPDMIVGASAGAMNGWAIAGGASPEELAAAWLDPETANLIRRRLGPTLFDPAPMRRAVRSLFERFQPRMSYATTLVEVPRLRARLVRGEQMTWRHLAAACAIPGGFPPVRLEGRWYLDGGLLGALPLWAAVEMGADRAIAIDALPIMPSRLVRGVVRVARAMGSPRTAPRDFPVTFIRPLSPLGNLQDVCYWNEPNVRRWLAQGEHDAVLSLATGAAPEP